MSYFLGLSHNSNEQIPCYYSYLPLVMFLLFPVHFVILWLKILVMHNNLYNKYLLFAIRYEEVSYGQQCMTGCIVDVMVSSKQDTYYMLAHFFRRWSIWSIALQYSDLVLVFSDVTYSCFVHGVICLLTKKMGWHLEIVPSAVL